MKLPEGREPVRPPSADGRRRRETLEAQQLNAEVGTKIAEARRLLETDPDKAIAISRPTLEPVKAAELPETVARTMTRRLEVAIELAKKDKVAFDAKMKDKDARPRSSTSGSGSSRPTRPRRTRMKELMDKAEDAPWPRASTTRPRLLAKAAEIDPNEVAARSPAVKAKHRAALRDRDLDNKAARRKASVDAFQDVDAGARSSTPRSSSTGSSYAKDFKDLTERRRMNERLDAQQGRPQMLAIETKLNEPVTLNFDKQPLGEAINFLQNYTGLNIVLDPKALDDEGAHAATRRSTCTANGIKLKTVLKLMLRPLGLTYKVEDEVSC